VYKTLALTGLRYNELRTLTVAQVDLTPGREMIRLDAADEKSREGNTIALRSDLADDFRQWLADNGRSGTERIFDLPASLRLVFDRDLQAADIPKRDDRGRTLDIHALRTTFATWLSLADVSPRTAQAALRHSDIKLTMGTYTDARLLDTRRAIEKLPLLRLPGRTDASVHQSVTSPGYIGDSRNGSK
jgi:integrase